MQSERLLLRAVEPSDIDFIFHLENDTVNWKVSNTLMPFSRYSIEQYVLSTENDLYSQKQLRLIIEAKDTTEPKRLGCIDLFDFDALHKRAGLGIIIIAAEQNKGYASESLELLINHCFNILGLHQLYCNISIDNHASITLFQKHGFISCGQKKEWIFHNDQWEDELMLQLIKR
jgi:diamine N-acetyltransferase